MILVHAATRSPIRDHGSSAIALVLIATPFIAPDVQRGRHSTHQLSADPPRQNAGRPPWHRSQEIPSTHCGNTMLDIESSGRRSTSNGTIEPLGDADRSTPGISRSPNRQPRHHTRDVSASNHQFPVRHQSVEHEQEPPTVDRSAAMQNRVRRAWIGRSRLGFTPRLARPIWHQQHFSARSTRHSSCMNEVSGARPKIGSQRPLPINPDRSDSRRPKIAPAESFSDTRRFYTNANGPM